MYIIIAINKTNHDFHESVLYYQNINLLVHEYVITGVRKKFHTFSHIIRNEFEFIKSCEP